MPTTFQGLLQSDTSRKPSDAVWTGCPWLEIFSGQRSGCMLYEDFTTFTNTGANGQVPGWKILGTNGTAALLATDDGGVLEMATSTTQNNEAYAAYGQTTGGIGEILNATPNEFFFEARVRVASTVLKSGIFVGLAKPGDIASGFLTASTAVPASTVNYVGFNLQATTALQIAYAKAAAPTYYNTAAQTVVINTWYKLGIHYFGNHKAGQNNNTIRFYINGVEIGNTAGTSSGVTATATNFPSSVYLTPTLMAINPADTTNVKLDVDWVRALLIVEDATYG